MPVRPLGVYHHYTTPKGTSSADWQQQRTTSDPRSNRLQNDDSTIRLIHLIDDYNPYYPNPDYAFDPYWEANCYNQHHLYYYQNFNKPNPNIATDSFETDQTLNTVLAKARVDPLQHDAQLTYRTTHSDTDDGFHRGGPQVSLGTAVAARLSTH